ncbi:Cell wall-active antibiotics response 4TMS YvqF [Marininema mesophilum]|uniref:Cell wall-active antibiotics response 4TMS YvqF n=1 Tax=Marininema mesophilum TaxID=1048340 RepID=A0A1H3B464_9BACL|nr:cell wall-active antibiotics response protein LiaF [Marininema mesophilum]SDX36585.1 Cell wall-active antibiotics response 4TMS YvqF [Marininema mesophilum]
MKPFFSKSTLIAFIIITLGVLFLLENIGILTIPVSTLISTWWPVLFFVVATAAFIKGLKPLFRKQSPHLGPMIVGTVLFLVGWNLLANKLGFDALNWKTIAGILWPLAIIYFGLRILFPGYAHKYYRHRMHRTIHDAENQEHCHHRFSHAENPYTYREAKKAYREATKRHRSRQSNQMMFGEIRIGKKPFQLENKEYWIGAGSIDLNLTQAIIPDQEVTIDIAGWFGEIQVYIPSHLPVRIEAFVRTGSLKILDNDDQGGFNRFITTKTPDFDEATKRLVLNFSLTCGEIRVIRV